MSKICVHRENTLTLKCNHDTVDLEGVAGNDVDMLKGLLEEHLEKTGSSLAKSLLDDWTISVNHFTKACISCNVDDGSDGHYTPEAGYY